MKQFIPIFILVILLSIVTTKYINLRIAYKQEVINKLEICKEYEKIRIGLDTCVSRKF